MANNYTQFSFAFKVKGLKAKAWIEKTIDKLVKASNDEEADEEILEMFPDWEDYLDVGFRTEMEPVASARDGKPNLFELIIFSEESGNVDHAANFVQAILSRFDPKGKVGFQWADTCDKMRPDQFGGGACVVTAEKQKWLNTFTWMNKEMSK
jgi:hypothetical protein